MLNKILRKRYNTSIQETEEDLIEERIKNLLRQEVIKKKIQAKFNFEIPGYVLDEMIMPSENLLLFINVAVINNRISKEDARYLKMQFAN